MSVLTNHTSGVAWSAVKATTADVCGGGVPLTSSVVIYCSDTIISVWSAVQKKPLQEMPVGARIATMADKKVTFSNKTNPRNKML